MGVCGSKPKGCVGMKGKLKLQKKRKKRTRRVIKAHSSNNRNRVEPSNQKDLSYNNPAFQGHSESWFDPDAVIDSDGEDEFYSVQDDVSQAGSLSNVVTPRFSNQVVYGNGTDSQLSSDDPQCQDENAERNEPGALHSCGFISNAFLPCLACDESLDGKRKSQSLGGPSTRKRLSFTPSLKWKEGQDHTSLRKCWGISLLTQCFGNYNIFIVKGVEGESCMKLLPILIYLMKTYCALKHLQYMFSFEGFALLLLMMFPLFYSSASAKVIIQRPIAGSQIMCSPLEKKMPESWSWIEPNSLKDKKKEIAPNYAAYVPFGVDVFLSPRKIDHIARFVELPTVDSPGEVPPILVVNLQIPLYPATIFQNEYDGAGMSFVFYFKLSENYSADLPVHFRENIRRIIANETEKIKSFPMDTNAPFRERLKILGRVANLEDLQLSAAERKLMHAYNEKPVLSRPQHEFYLGENYFEIDLDIHRFSYIARKGFETFQDRIKHCVFDFGLTIQGNKAEDLPECMLCCIRLKEIDYTNYCQLSF
ncbi:UNVERIFIED_CONTAM: hypothetical protein Sradi_3055200 [Sesamum radiatum]|uniref:Protein ENHANCED DISEASE RESISTANCE 2 C-terminal domain-containing protein n=1 Tax=Sesamum radiatum TaxID=300843 RepID=A0AAW2RBI2_SESRA